MLFMVTSRPKAGTTREQLIEHLTRRLDPSTWDLIPTHPRRVLINRRLPPLK